MCGLREIYPRAAAPRYDFVDSDKPKIGAMVCLLRQFIGGVNSHRGTTENVTLQFKLLLYRGSMYVILKSRQEKGVTNTK